MLAARSRAASISRSKKVRYAEVIIGVVLLALPFIASDVFLIDRFGTDPPAI